MYISKDQTLKALQEQFQQKYPLLNIAFYSKKPIDGVASKVEDQLHTHELVKDIQQRNHEGSIELNDEMTVSTFENLCAQYFGLYVQVLRKSGQLWLQTTQTNHWTLAKQQEEAAIMNRENPNEELDDYHEQE